MGCYECQTVGIEDQVLPYSTELFQNYPNPFNPVTTIKYSLKDLSKVKLKIYDILGREVVEIVNQKQDQGYHEAKFNAEKLSSGMYFYQMKVDNTITSSTKMMMIK